ncbi:hypothetical protein [Proteus mirabilis]|uniref:hypothetical protein n=1 Tax=Proteus mirabilis TaxID=584 RepID=UPI0034D4EA8A
MAIEIVYKNTLNLKPCECEGRYKGRFIVDLSVKRFMGGETRPRVGLRLSSVSEEKIKVMVDKGLSFTDGMSHNISSYTNGIGGGEITIELYSDKEYDKLINLLNEWRNDE